MALGVMTRFWSLRPRSLCAGFWAGERVMGVSQNISGLRRNSPVLAIASKSLTCSFCIGLALYGEMLSSEAGFYADFPKWRKGMDELGFVAKKIKPSVPRETTSRYDLCFFECCHQ